MRDDTREELERIEKELLAEQPEEAVFPEAVAEPAFEDTDVIHVPDGPMVYCNYSNDYGRDLKEFAENGGKCKEGKDEKLTIGLMITASTLCLGIVGILIYWLAAYL